MNFFQRSQRREGARILVLHIGEMSRANLTQSNLSQSGLTLLSDFLRTTYPHDVIIPCGLGDKRPYHPYKLGWTWEDFDREIASGKSFDWAIILHDLCVVDCDSPEAAADLEARFPLLRDVACAKTRKGMHFYFKRSSLADAGGYYDCSGYAQIIKNIDFKSVTSTGTGGISAQRGQTSHPVHPDWMPPACCIMPRPFVTPAQFS